MTAAFGFFGKIPSRGDFVRHGLPQDFLAPLDEWFQHALSGSRPILGDAWVDAWMEAPVWRFGLAQGLCGPGVAAGVWLPSTDKAGRLFPLVFAVTAPRWSEIAACGVFLDAAERIGRQTIEGDPAPEAIAAALSKVATLGGGTAEPPEPGCGTWWTEGSPRVAPARRISRGMPEPAAFASMLQDAPPEQPPLPEPPSPSPPGRGPG